MEIGLGGTIAPSENGRYEMSDARLVKMAKVLVDYSIDVKPGERIFIESTTAAEPIVREVFKRILEKGGHPLPVLAMPDQEEIYLTTSGPEQLDFVPVFHQLAAEEFDARIRIYCEMNTRALSGIDPARQMRCQKALAPIQRAVMDRAARGEMRWISTQFPTQAYAMEAEMGWQEYQDFSFRACHVDDDTDDPVAFWQGVKAAQEGHIRRVSGKKQVTVKGPNADLQLSIEGRTFLNSCGIHNLPDGEIYTGPVENSAQGWVRFTYPAMYGGRAVEGIELHFEQGKVVKAASRTNQDFLLSMLDTDAGARYIGEFAIGTNFEINRFTHNILYDEKIGGSFHLALGASYPETGGLNRSAIHWDMICDLRTDSEIRVDGDLFYKNGEFVK